MRNIPASLCLMILVSGCRPSSTAPENSTNPHAQALSSTEATPTQWIEKFNLQDIRNGLKSMSLVAETAQVYETEHYADVAMPFVTFYSLDASNKETSHLRAPQGRVDLTTHAMESWGGVTVVTSDSTTLKTERLRYDPAIRKIVSDSPVELLRPGAVTRGVGLESDPELKRVIIRKQKAVIQEKK